MNSNNCRTPGFFAVSVGPIVLACLLASCATPPPPEPPKAAPAPVVIPPPPPKKPLPPVAAVKNVTETHFGISVVDHYRYMEDVANPDVVAFLRGQGEFSRRALDAIPGRKAMQERIGALSESGVAISNVQVAGEGTQTRVFYYKLAPGDASRKLFVREGFNGAERLLLDPAAISQPGLRYAIDSFVASPDGRSVVIGIAAGGSEDTSLRIVDVATGKENGEVIDRIGFADITKWSPDGKFFFYNRLPQPKTGAPKNRYLRSMVYRHVLGRPVDKDEQVFGPGLDTRIIFADIDIPSVRLSADGKFLVGQIKHGDLNEVTLYVANTMTYTQGQAWRKAVDAKDEVTSFVLHDNTLYLLSHKDAPRYKVLRTGLGNPSVEKATTIVPHGDTVIRELAVAQDALYIRELSAGLDRLQRLNFSQSVFSGGKLEFVRLPFDLAIRQMITNPKRPGALLRLEGWTEPPRYSTVEERSGNLVDTKLQPKTKVDFDGIDEVRLMATAKDGTKIPLSLIYKKGTTLNADHPTLLRAYGAYGITMAPTFSPTTLAWLERGGIIGTCHVRGGGEFGEEWHQGGQKLTKPNTWRDLIACGEYVIERKFTRKEKLAIAGGSAGGITVGRALTERPDLFAAVVSSVGVLDSLRAEFTPNGPPNIPEFGTVKNEAGFKGLLAMSAMHNVKDGTKYPAVLLMHGVNDPRVEVWQSAKMAARLQAAVAADDNANPVLLRLDYDAGHGVGSSRTQRDAETADIYSFLLWQFGDPAFQPKPVK
ncbi:MAG: prolyl oligopeptidase family serine peptidase [Betaproteobacteria bacterium]